MSLVEPGRAQFTFNRFYNASDDRCSKEISNKIASFCAAMGENPVVRYRGEGPNNKDLARDVQAQLDVLSGQSEAMTQSKKKDTRSQLIIIDRGFDAVTPAMYDIGYESLVMDMMNVKDGKCQVAGTEETIVTRLPTNGDGTDWRPFRPPRANVTTEVT